MIKIKIWILKINKNIFETINKSVLVASKTKQ